ncbi:MAG: FAD-dependent oxidoreductase [Thermoanaerobaculia bacterium]
MADARPHIAILGAGPTGLEAALAAIDGGFPFTLYEADEGVAGDIRRWGHVRLFTPWSLNVSPRMRRHLYSAGIEVPDTDDCPLGSELVARLLEPLAALSQLAPHLHTATRVLEVGKEQLVKNDEVGTGRRADHRFRLLVAGPDGTERTATADVVLDCTGSYGNPNATGNGGIAAPGEREMHGVIRRHIPDFAAETDEWAGQTVLVVGAGHSAQTAVADLAALAEAHPGTRVLWALRSAEPSFQPEDADPLPARAQLLARAAELAAGASPAVETLPGVVVDSLSRNGEKTRVTLRQADGGEHSVDVDWVLSLTGYVGDHSLYRQLQVHECYATSGPMKLAAALLGSGSDDCLAQESHGAETLVNPEPGFFLLGSKSYGRNPTFLMRVGWEQVEEVFGLLETA